MKIIFSDINPNVTESLKAYFPFKNVEVYTEDIFLHKADAIISPANSFGFMDGGIDYAYSKYFGWDLQKRLQEEIHQYFHGELLVGLALAIETYNDNIPWLISAPTMRVPTDISNTVNVYLAFKAALRAAKRENIESLLSPGLGTCTGNVHPSIAAYQMRVAYEEVINNKPIKYENYIQALTYDRLMRGKNT